MNRALNQDGATINWQKDKDESKHWMEHNLKMDCSGSVQRVKKIARSRKIVRFSFIYLNQAMDRVETCTTKHFVRVNSNKMIANRMHVAAEGSGESSFLKEFKRFKIGRNHSCFLPFSLS